MSIIDRERLIAAVSGWVGNCVIFDQLDSTHLFSQRLIGQLDDEDTPVSPTLVLAESQTGGLGRAQKTWSSDSGGLYLNVVWAATDPTNIAQLPMLAAAAVHQAVTGVEVKNAAIKWPNDILVDGHKLGGILIHARHGARLLATVGFGINITKTPDLGGLAGPQATSLAEILGPGDEENRSISLITTFLDHFCRSLRDPGPAVEHWKAHLVHQQGESISLSASGGTVVSGTYAGVNPDGHLMIQTENGLQTLTGGDIVEVDGS